MEQSEKNLKPLANGAKFEVRMFAFESKMQEEAKGDNKPM